MDCSPPGSCVHGILQAWILEWVAISFSSWIFGIIQYVAFSDWLLSLIHIWSSFMPFHGLISHFFLVLNNIPLYGCATVLFIYLLKDIFTVSQFWRWYTYKVAINIHGQTFVWTSVFNSFWVNICVCVSCSVMSDFWWPHRLALQVPLSMEFSMQEHWSG